MRELRDQGFSQAYALKGGFVEWVKAGYPTERKNHVQDSCVTCHEQVSPNIVREWKQSAHSTELNAVSCSVCHGQEHRSVQDVHKARAVPEKVCRTCHEKEYVQFSQGKHATAWKSMRAWPDFHHPLNTQGKKRECTHCHSIGFKTREEIKILRSKDHPTGAASCNNCHTGHTYSLHEARQPEACQPCHQGPFTPHYQAYAGSKHARLFPVPSDLSSKNGIQFPSCQNCHFPEAMHGVHTSWGSLGLRLPWPKDAKWAVARRNIMQALGLYSPQGEPTVRFSLIPELQLMTLSQARWTFRRNRMQGTCMHCHDSGFASDQLDQADTILRQSDLLMSQGINLVKEMGRSGNLGRPAEPTYVPDIGTYADQNSPEEKLVYRMFHIHRAQAWQGAFHSNWDMARKGLERMKGSLRKLQ